MGGIPGTRTASANVRESLLIGRGDLSAHNVFREPDLEQKVRVKDSGDIDLDLAGTIKVAGLTPADAAKAIAGLYTRGTISTIRRSRFSSKSMQRRAFQFLGR